MPEEPTEDTYYLPGTIWCLSCAAECETHTVDFGIGSYEMGDGSYYHTDEHEVSQCCDAEFTEQTPQKRTP